MAEMKHMSDIQNEEGNDVITICEEVKERSLLRKLDARLLPGVGILYLLSFLDRSNGMTMRRSRFNSTNMRLSWKCPY